MELKFKERELDLVERRKNNATTAYPVAAAKLRHFSITNEK